jgi:hypothetical protein
MPKRPKAKVHNSPRPAEKPNAENKMRRHAVQLEAAERNRENYPELTPWEKKKAVRTNLRKIQGKPLAWSLKKSKEKEKEKPSASNTRY